MVVEVIVGFALAGLFAALVVLPQGGRGPGGGGVAERRRAPEPDEGGERESHSER